MPSPFDYTLSGADPMLSLQQGMGFNQQQRQGEQNLLAGQQNMDLAASQEARNATQFGQQNTLFDQGQQDRQAMLAAQEAERQKALAMQTDLVGLSEIVRGGGATANDFAAIAVKYPDLADEMSKTWEGQTQERKAADMGNIFKAATAIKSGAPQIAIDMLEERAAAAEAAGDKMEADVSRAMAATIQADPSAGLTTLGLLMHSVDPKAAVELFGEGGGAKEYGLTPQYGTDKDGNLVAIQFAKDGTSIATPLPEGVALSKGIEKLDLGYSYQYVNTMTGESVGQPIKKNLGEEAATVAKGKAQGEATAAAEAALPGASGLAGAVNDQVEALKADPYLENMLGPIDSRLPNATEDAARVQGMLDQLQGGAFLQARQLLKGGGAITDFEGKKAEAAFVRMNTAQKPEDFKAALDEFNLYVQQGVAKLEAQAGVKPPANGVSDDDLLKKYGG